MVNCSRLFREEYFIRILQRAEFSYILGIACVCPPLILKCFLRIYVGQAHMHTRAIFCFKQIHKQIVK